MRRDEALLHEADAGAPLTLRLYRWSHPTLTLGHGQTPRQTTDPDALAASGVGWVSRPTGGRALLHLPDELTYAVAAPKGWAAGVRAAYFRVMRSIWAALSGFVDLDPPPAGLRPRDTAPPRLPCQAVATGHEITARGQKLVAGAQRWRRGAFLQHGSIPWTVDRVLTNSLAGLPADSPVGAVGLSELAALQRGAPPPSIPKVAAALERSFREAARPSC
jgi:lipoate-protein ligase A